jgi:hypothetical protein
MRISNLLKSTMFMMAADPKTGGGAGGDEGGDDEKLAQAVAAAVAAALPKALNGAITSHLNRAMAKVEERFAKLEKPPGDEGDGDGSETPPGTPPKGKGQPDPAMVALQKRLEQTEKKLAAEEAARTKAVAETRMREERGALQEELTKAGVRKELIGPAVAYLHAEQKKLKRISEEGKDDRLVWAEGDDELSLADGVKAWAKTDVGMSFLPARDAGGSGGSGGRKLGGGGGAAPDAASDEALVSHLLG